MMSENPSNMLESGGGLGDAPRLTQSDCKLIERAARWPMTPEKRQQIVDKLMFALGNCDTVRDYASVGKALIAIEGQNQADDHLADKNSRLDAGKPTEHVAGFTLNIGTPLKPPAAGGAP